MDSTAIFFRKGLYPNMLTVPEVIEEIKDDQSVNYLSMLEISVEEPKPSCLEKVKVVARKTGDIHRLSETDLKILALALSKKEEGENPIIVTDDYSIQNVAKVMSLQTDSIIQKGIRYEFKWIRKCRGCKRVIKEQYEKCPVCGGEVYLVRKKLKRDKA